MNRIVEVVLWGTTVGHLGYAPGQTETATFQFDDEFMNSGIQLSPIVMRCPPAIHEFPDISSRTFHGLPGIFADSLPDSFGNQLIDIYMAERGIPANQVTALDRLLYMGDRGMGAFEYRPAADFGAGAGRDSALDIAMLSKLSELVLKSRHSGNRKIINAENRRQALRLIRIGSSAGGARSKALVATGPGGIFDGTSLRGPEYRQWILKFDSTANRDRELGARGAVYDPSGMTRVEYIYSLIARDCGINMPETDFIEDGGRFHFLISRFDRGFTERGAAKHLYASWAGLAHADRDTTGAYSYEQLVLAARGLGIGADGIRELFRRAVFNIIGRNQDDHTKNFGFMMDRSGRWSLSPAFDLTYAYDPAGRWTRMHQLQLAGKQDEFSLEHILRFGRYCGLSEKQGRETIRRTEDAFARFGPLAAEYGVPANLSRTVEHGLRRLSPRKG